ncbi:hypothetical protein BdWA1_000477 [Babesia duncani]|uniref:Uncharacterized protein n=1 Tax=Babesia duncani TaxID=323732 RepID=A0AAD9PN60_9APIC|nr:hypothetical protein BdWA1_000477 [Babesia duncani]
MLQEGFQRDPTAEPNDKSDWLSSIINKSNGESQNVPQGKSSAKLLNNKKVLTDYDVLYTNLSHLESLLNDTSFNVVDIDEDYWSKYKEYMKRYNRNRLLHKNKKKL